MVDFQRLSRPEGVQLVAVAVFGVSLFLGWYGTDTGNPNSSIDGRTGTVTAWQAHPVLRWVFLAVVISGLLSAWQTARAQEPSGPWVRGEMSVVVAAVTAGLVLMQGLVVRPGTPEGSIDLRFGWFLALAAALAAIVAALARLTPHAERKPPGV